MEKHEELTITQAAAIKGVRRTTIHAAIVAGRLAGHVVKTGVARTVWMVYRDDLDAYHVATPEERQQRATAARAAKMKADAATRRKAKKDSGNE